MTHISKHPLPEQELTRLRAQLSKAVANLNKTSANPFLTDLLGPEEYTMLAKRLAAIVLYMEGNSTYTVWNTLNISPSTAERIKLNFEIGKYKRIVTTLKKSHTDYVEFWKTLETLLQLGLPPRGKGRWRSVLSNHHK
jgi:uncharacterized protein YerC